MRVHCNISILTVVVLKTLQLVKNLMGTKISIYRLFKVWNVTNITTNFAVTNFDKFDIHS